MRRSRERDCPALPSASDREPGLPPHAAPRPALLARYLQGLSGAPLRALKTADDSLTA
jgi:hypothetical protein